MSTRNRVYKLVLKIYISYIEFVFNPTFVSDSLKIHIIVNSKTVDILLCRSKTKNIIALNKDFNMDFSKNFMLKLSRPTD